MDRHVPHPEREDDVALLEAIEAPASEQVSEGVQGDRVGQERGRLASFQEPGERAHGDRPGDAFLAHRPDLGQCLHRRTVEQPLVAIQFLGRELAGAGMSQVIDRGRNRLWCLLREPYGPLIDQPFLGGGKGVDCLRMVKRERAPGEDRPRRTRRE